MMAFGKFDPNDPESERKIRSILGPHATDQALRQAVQMCWMSLPKERRNPDEIEKEIRSLVDRVLRDFREDTKRFGLGG
jgi:hypothetical protein